MSKKKQTGDRVSKLFVHPTKTKPIAYVSPSDIRKAGWDISKLTEAEFYEIHDTMRARLLEHYDEALAEAATSVLGEPEYPPA